MHWSVVHGLPSSQLTQAAPALPHAVTLVPALQVEPLRQPVQQLPPEHFPPVQLLVLLVCVQPPLVQASVVQAFPSSQLTQIAPAVPQAVTLVPALQADPELERQPVQQLPLAHLPFVHVLPFDLFVVVHPHPLLQVDVLHSPGSGQLLESGWQVFRHSQQPLQVVQSASAWVPRISPLPRSMDVGSPEEQPDKSSATNESSRTTREWRADMVIISVRKKWLEAAEQTRAARADPRGDTGAGLTLGLRIHQEQRDRACDP